MPSSARLGNAQAALQLLSDPTPAVRQASSEFLCAHARLFREVPSQVLQQVAHEVDPVVTSSLISFMSEVPDRRGFVEPILLHLVSDPRPGIAGDAVRALCEGEGMVRNAYIPLGILVRTLVNREDAVREGLRDIVKELEIRDHTLGDTLDRFVHISERARKLTIKNALLAPGGEWEARKLESVAIGFCLPGKSERTLCARYLAASGKSLPSEHRPIIWSALAFAMRGYEHASLPAQHEFFCAVRDSEMPCELSSLIESFDCRTSVDARMARDFTGVYMSRHANPYEAVERLVEILWAPTPNIVLAAASNLSLLVPDVDHDVGQFIVRRLMDALIERAGDGAGVVNAFIAAFERLESFTPEVLTLCSATLAANQPPEVMDALARVIGSMPPADPILAKEALGILEYLSRSPYARVAQTARRILSR